MSLRLAFLVLVCAPAFARGQFSLPIDRVAATVNGEKITESQVKSILDQRPLVTPVPESEARAIRKAALDILIEEALMRQFLRANVQYVNEAEIDRVLDTVSASLQKKNQTLEEFLRGEKQNLKQLREDIAAKLRWQEYLTKRLSEVEVLNYYQQFKPYFDMRRVRASHILVSMPVVADVSTKQATANKVEAIRQKLNAGETFEKLAREHSDCPSKDKDGDIGFFRYKFMVVEPVARAAFEMKKGETRIIESEFGWHLLRVTDIDPGQPSTFPAVKDFVRETIAQERQMYREILKSQRENSKIQIELDR